MHHHGHTYLQKGELGKNEEYCFKEIEEGWLRELNPSDSIKIPEEHHTGSTYCLRENPCKQLKKKSVWLNNKARKVTGIKKLAFKIMKMHLSAEKKKVINSDIINIKL